MGSWSWNIATGKIQWSDEFKLLHGLPLDTPSNYEYGRDLIHPDDKVRVLRELERISLLHRSTIFSPSTAPSPQMAAPLGAITRHLQRDPAGKPLILNGITFDLTDSRLAEEALRRTEKLAAAGRMAATVAHEVNNPLESLTNLIFLASTAEDLPPEVKTYLLTAEAEISRMAHIVRQTLGFYRESSTPRSVDIASIATEVLDLYRSRAEPAIFASRNHGPRLVALANAGELKQVLPTSFPTPLDASPAGGAIDSHRSKSGNTIEITRNR